MFGRQAEPIDASAEIEASAEQRKIEGERGASTLGVGRRRLPAGTRPLIVAILLASLVLGGVAIWKARGVRTAAVEKKNRHDETVSNTLPPLVRTAAAAEPEETAQATAQAQAQAQAKEREAAIQAASHPVAQPPAASTAPPPPKPPTRAELLEKRRLSSGQKSEGGSAAGAITGNLLPMPDADMPAGGGELQRSLQPLKLQASAAGVLGDRNYLLTQGAMIDCVLETRIITTQPGMTACYGTRDVYSTNGAVVLAPRGTKYIGNYQSGIKQGQARIFVLWTRLETPEGVIVALDSPGTGPLGEAGVGGTVDNHFFDRFGTAVLISLIGDVGQFVAAQGQQKGSNNTIQFGGTTQGAEQASVEILKSTLNIPPTLYLNQGDRVAIFVARDLDFSGVYSLRSE